MRIFILLLLDQPQDKDNDPKSVMDDEMNSEAKDKTPQQNEHQNQVFDTPSPIFKDSELGQESPRVRMERYPQYLPQSLKAVSHNSHASDDSDTISFHQKTKVTNISLGYRSQRLNTAKHLPVYHELNASSALRFDHFGSPRSKFNRFDSNTHPKVLVDHPTNVKQFLNVLGGHTGSLKDSCLSFYEQVMNPTFQPIPVCGSRDYPMHTVHCYQSSMNIASYQQARSLKTILKHSEVNVGMGVTCTFRNIAVNGRNIMKSLRDCARNCDVRSSKSLFLLEGKQSQCPIPTISLLMNRTNQHDYTRNFVQELLMLNKKKHLQPSRCGQWVNKTALFFIANEPYNVYFQFLTYYNVFLTINLLSSMKESALKGLVSFRSDPRDLVVVRLSDATDYKFGDFERKLFPQLTVLSNLTNDTRSASKDTDITCFQGIVKVPWAYSAFPFRSVVDSRLKNKTLKCYNTVRNPIRIDTQTKQKQGVGENANDVLSRQTQTGVDQHNHSIEYREIQFAAEGSQTVAVVPSMIVFRSLVLKVCGIKESDNVKSSISRGKVVVRRRFPLQVVVIKRKPYLRHGLDHPNLFQRILSNEDELITALMHNISRGFLNVTSVYMEELDICSQVKVAHSADILIGVHGAGLVHSWWIRESGMLLELVPLNKLDRPTYRILAGLTGRKYYSIILKSSPLKHNSYVSISAVLELLARITKEWTAGM